MKRKLIPLLMAFIMLFMTSCAEPQQQGEASTFFFPSEEVHHEGTWITWPHKYADKQSYYFGE